MGIKGGEKSLISTKKINANLIMISLVLISLAAIFTFGVDNASAAQIGNISIQDENLSNNLSSANSQTLTETVQNTTANTSKSNQTSTSKSKVHKSPDPQIWNNGAPVSRGGHPAGYVYSTIAAAINDAIAGDTIMLENGATFTERITVNKALTFDVLNNGHATIDGTNGGRIVTITATSGTITFNDITFVNGRINNDGGAIYNNFAGTTVIVNNCIFTNNVVTGNNHDGAAIYSVGSLTVNNCNFTSNSAAANGGAIYSGNGLTVTNSNFTSNTAINGGAIYNNAGTSTITSNNFISNSATTRGGAFYNANGAATLQFNRITGNTPNNNQIRQNGGTVNANNNWWGDNAGSTGKTSGTVTATTYIVLTVTASPAQIPTSGTSTVTADLNHLNNGNLVSGGQVPDGIPVTFTCTSLGSINPVSGTTLDGIITTLFTAGSNSGIATANATVDDENVGTDITIGTDIYVSTSGSDTTGDGSQSNPYQTISKGISMVYPGGTVHILSGTYNGTNNRNIAISKNVNLIGEGGIVTIDGQSTSVIFTINSGYTVTMSNLTLTNGDGGDGGAISNSGNLTIIRCNFANNTASNVYGGAIYSVGILTVVNSSFTDNIAYDGGAISGGTTNVLPTGPLTITNCTFTHNIATSAGGAIWSHGTLIVTNSTFTDNDANISGTAGTPKGCGGAIRNWGTLNVTGSTFVNNTATTNAAAISNYQGTTTANFNRFIGNGPNDINAEYNGATSTVNAENNWWGSNSGPNAGRVTAATGATIDANPWLILTITSNPNSIRRNGTSTVTAYLTRNSNGVDTSSLGYLPDGITVTFGNDNLGTVNPTTNTTVNSKVNTVFTAKNTPGVARVSATVDGVIVYTDIIIGNVGNFIINNTIAYDDSIIYLHDTGLFHITVHNNGPDGATGVKVTFTIPAGLQLIAVNPIVGTYDTLTSTWTIGNISNNGTAYLDLLLKAVQSGTSLTVTANVTGNEEGTDAVTSKTVNILRAADLQVTQTVSNITPNQGNSITSTITVKNNGPDSANNITLYYKPPAGLNIVSIIPSVGSYNSATGLWTISSLAWNGTATLTITATVTAPSGTIINNTARVIREDEIDKRYNSANTANIRVGGASYTPKIDLEIYNYYYNYDQDSVSGTVQRKLKDTAMFYIDLHNNGPDDATGVKVTLIIPAGYQLLVVNPKSGTFDSLTNTWNAGTLCSGGWAYFDYVLKVIQSNTTLNTTANATATETDTNSSNNGASAIVQVPAAADLNVNQTVNNTHPSTGSTVNYTVTVTNNGPNAVNNVALNDLLPSTYFSNVSSSADTGSYNSATGVWNIGTLGAGATATLTLTATVTASNGTLIKTNATLINGSGMDYNLTDQEKEMIIQVYNP